jgi:hypothetical protein
VVWITTGETFRREQGAPRVGTVPDWSTGALAAALVVLLIAIWWRAVRRPEDEAGAASLAAVGALLACSPLFSVQYAAWLLPWAAIAWARGHRPMVWTTAAISVVTGAVVLVYTPDDVVPAQLLLLVRNAAVVALPMLWLVGFSRDRTSPALSP